MKSKRSVDLEKMIHEHVWKRYLNSIGRMKALFAKKHKHTFDLPWEFLDFKHKTTISALGRDDQLLDSVDFGTPVADRHRFRRKRKSNNLKSFYKSVSLDMEAPVVLCTDYFVNKSTIAQNYTCPSERISSAVSVEFCQNFTLGDTTNIELSLSDVTSSSGSFITDTLHVTDTKKQCFQDVYVFDKNTLLEVKAGHRVEAVTSAYENQTISEFEVKSKMTLIIGCLPVVMRRQSDNEVVFTCFITSLYDVFRRHQGSNLSLIRASDGHCDVVMTSTGKCTFTGWSDPQIHVQYESLFVQ